jgi:2-polyprenyl-6-methoxyphenol hydroxylase-like FAD-dependent oxidoreductase
MRALIVGGGIGGLAAAVGLRRVGVEVLVLERVGAIREVGAGLAVWSNGMNALRELGVEQRVLASASVIDRITSRTSMGQLITVNDFAGIIQSAGAPCICVHRAVLQRILLEELPPECVRTGANCVGFDDSTAILEGGDRIVADVLIGADGIRSVVRDQLHGASLPRYAGYTCWRGICRDPKETPDPPWMAVGSGTQFGVWPCGKGQLYWFLTKNAPPGTTRTKADAFGLSHWAAPTPEIISATPEDAIVQNDIADRPPLSSWGRDRVTLLGDAAHAMTPNMGQGACQALEDAVVLANCLSRTGPAEAALRQYESLRIPRTTAIVRKSREAGRILQLDRPGLESLRNWFMATSIAESLATRTFRDLLTYRVPVLRFP